MTKGKMLVTPDRFMCDVCQETKIYLTNHMISEHGHPGEIFYCNYWGLKEDWIRQTHFKKHK